MSSESVLYFVDLQRGSDAGDLLQSTEYLSAVLPNVVNGWQLSELQ